MEGQERGARADESFPRRCRLGGNRNYRYVYRRGKSYPSRNLVLVHLKGREQRFGFSVSAKVGNAVTRNRIRRYLREDVRRLRMRLKSGKYIFVARPAAKMAAHEELTRELENLLRRARLVKEDDPR